MPSSPRQTLSPDAMIGRTIGRYRVIAKLGHGGMGTVWKCEDTLLRRTVALKFLPESLAGSAEAGRRFLREARAASRLEHPGVATVFDAGEIEGLPFIAIECIEGDTVHDRLAGGPLPVPEAVRVAREAAEALAHAHERGVLHRDLSARNLMVTREGRVKILDFGLALPKGASRLTSSGMTLGTLAYLAPEVILGSHHDPKSDIYSLSVVLYEMLTGSPPYRGERAEALLYAIVNAPLEPPSRRRAGIPAEVEEVTLRALARDPADRTPSAQAFAAALHDVESSALELSRPPTTRPRRRPRTAPDRFRTSALPTAAAPRYLAVMPFAELGAEPATPGEAFALGVTESVSAQLARYRGILVVPATSSAAFRGTPDDVGQVARALGADLVLRGVVQRSGSKLRISYSLIDALRGLQLAGDNLDGPLSDLFPMQDRLARRVAEALRLERAPSDPSDATPLGAVAAQERYLQALGYLKRFDNESQVDGATALLTGLRDGGDDSAAVEAALGRSCLFKYQITRETVWQERAEDACRRALELGPRSPDVLVTLGSLQRGSGRAAEAVKTFRQALKLRPDDPEALLGLAKSLAACGKLAPAEETYYRSLALRPAFWGAYNDLGGFYFNHGRYDRAVSMWSRVVQLTPDNARGYLNLGGAYFRMGRFEKAISAFQRSIAIRPEASAYSNLGTLHYFLGHRVEAAAMFEKAVALRPTEPRVWGNLADAYRWLPGHEERAAATFDRAIELMRGQLEVNPRNAEGVGWLAEWMARRGHTRQALQTVRRALKLSPQDVNCMARAVNVFHLAGQRGQALHWLGEALRGGYGLSEFERDPDLAALRGDPAYAALVEKQTTKR